MIMVSIMAKKKRSKTSESKGFQYSVELTGLFLILIGILGFGFGLVGNFIKKFSMFLVGELWPVLLVLIIVMGLHMIFKRKTPNFFSSKYIGFFILFAVILTLSHYSYLKSNGGTAILKQTLDVYS